VVLCRKKIKSRAEIDASKKRRRKILKIVLTITVLFLINLYIILQLIYRSENFTVTLDSEYGRESGLVIYESLQEKYQRTFLRSDDIEFFTDMCIDWLPKDINEEAEGSHNGEHYIAYTFYAENMGQDPINYWTRIDIDDVIKDVDDAIRVMVIRNDSEIVYAKLNNETGQPEREPHDTKNYPREATPFETDTIVMQEHIEDFKVGDIDKYTIVIWVEGDDPECKNNLIGGEIKMHMTLTEEHINLEKYEENNQNDGTHDNGNNNTNNNGNNNHGNGNNGNNGNHYGNGNNGNNGNHYGNGNNGNNGNHYGNGNNGNNGNHYSNENNNGQN